MIFKFREIQDSVDVTSLENKYGFQLPPIYKLFAETYLLGEEHIYIEHYKLNDSNIMFPLTTCYYLFKDTNIGFSHFVAIEKAFFYYDSGSLGDLEYERRHFPIASIDIGGLYVGTQGDERDKIFWNNEDGIYPQIIANNVFEFLRGIINEKVEEEYLYGNVKYNQLYKSFNEDFWRVQK
jgi:hypothetical protein